MRNPFATLWMQSPAVPYGAAAWAGVQCAVAPSIDIALYIFLILSPLLFHQAQDSAVLRRKTSLALAIALCFYMYTSSYYIFPEISPEGAAGQGHLHIENLNSRTTHFGKQWLMQGKLLSFQSQIFKFHKQLPITLTLPSSVQRPLANQDYWVEGKLTLTDTGKYTFLVHKQAPWQPIEGTWSFAEYRFKAKQAVNQYIHRNFKSSQSRSFLTGIATGTFDDRLMVHEFSRFGLQHIMAISGFHFAIIAGVFGFLLNCIFSKRTTSIVLILIMTIYFIFLGPSPSIIRAWLMCLIGLAAYVVEKPANGLNALGIALLGTLAYNPLYCQSLGFQFTFAITGALFLLYPPIDAWMQNWLKKRTLGQAIQLTFLEKHGYVLLTLIRQGLALALAINTVALPITLFYFHQFPLMSLLYNLFYPFFVSVSMVLLVMGGVFSLLFHSLGNGIHYVNDVYTHYLVQFTYNTPKSLDYMIHAEEISGVLVSTVVACVLMSGVYTRRPLQLIPNRKNKNSSRFMALFQSIISC